MLRKRLRSPQAFDPVGTDSLSLALDSGAHSVYMQMIVKKDAGGSVSRKYDVVKSEAFRNYVEEYIKFCHEHEDLLTFVVNLDVIGSAELTWELQKYLEENGLNPVPVFHNGEDFKWLTKYLDNYEYVGVGGMGQFVAKSSYIGHADKIFRMMTNNDGTPRVKIHGFAVTSPEIVMRYPWHSVDSSTWCSNSRFGRVLIPKIRVDRSRPKGYRYVYGRSPAPVRVSDRAFDLGAKDHLARHKDREQEELLRYLKDSFEGDLGPRYLRLIKDEYWARDVANGAYFVNLQEEAKEHAEQCWGTGTGSNVYLAGAPNVHDVKTMRAVYSRLMRHGKLNLLGTFFYSKVFQNTLQTFPLFEGVQDEN